MIFDITWFFLLVAVPSIICMPSSFNNSDSLCGCKVMRHCYAKMVDDLREQDEARCLESVEISMTTIMVYLRALTKYCPDLLNLTAEHSTAEGTTLYEVHLHKGNGGVNYNNLPLILIDAGQDAGEEPVQTAMLTIEHLVACQEHENFLTNFRWVILPLVNPDGLEYVQFDRPRWRKNTRKSGGISYGVDLTRNFDVHWEACPVNINGFSRTYPGPSPASEKETQFMMSVMKKHKKYISAYLSLRRDGHGILYPHAYTIQSNDVSKHTIKVAEIVSQKVNQRGGFLVTFLNTSIYKWKGEAWCGNSVDYVFSMGIQMSFELRVGFGQGLQIIGKYQKQEEGFQNILITSYFNGIKELASIVGAEFEKKKRESNT